MDTDNLIDLVSEDRPSHKRVMRGVRAGLMEGWEFRCLASSLKDVYYVVGRHYGDERFARAAVRYLREGFVVLDLTSAIVDRALESDEPDFEDGIVRATAELTGCNGLLTRDASGFRGGSVRKLSVEDLPAQ